MCTSHLVNIKTVYGGNCNQQIESNCLPRLDYLSAATAARVLADALTATGCRYILALHRKAPNSHSERKVIIGENVMA